MWSCGHYSTDISFYRNIHYQMGHGVGGCHVVWQTAREAKFAKKKKEYYESRKVYILYWKFLNSWAIKGNSIRNSNYFKVCDLYKGLPLWLLVTGANKPTSDTDCQSLVHLLTALSAWPNQLQHLYLFIWGRTWIQALKVLHSLYLMTEPRNQIITAYCTRVVTLCNLVHGVPTFCRKIEAACSSKMLIMICQTSYPLRLS